MEIFCKKLRQDSALWIILTLLMSCWDIDQLPQGITGPFPHSLPVCAKALMVTWIELTVTLQRPLIQVLPSEWLRVNKDKKKPVHSHLFSLTFSPCLVCLSDSLKSRYISPYSLSFDALWQIPFACNTSRSSAVTHHLMKSKDGNLLFIINKSLHCEKCLLFASALKTITVRLHFSCDCIA